MKAQTNTLQASTLGLLALILGFAFSLSLQTYHNRSEAVINEANAISTALMRTHVPEVIFYLMFIVFITSGAMIGYGSGLGQRRSNLPSALLSFMICLVVFIIIDLDRPMRGIIKVDQHSLERLKSDRSTK